MSHQTIEARLGELIPRDALRQLVAVLGECQRRAAAKSHVPREVRVVIEIDERGEVVDVEIPRRYGRNRS